MTAVLSVCRAKSGNSSEIWMPGTRVAMGAKWLRIPSAASGIGIPHVHLRRPTPQINQNARFRLAAGGLQAAVDWLPAKRFFGL